MTGDPIDRLRDADPATDAGHAAPFEDVMEWIRRRQLSRDRHRRIRRPGWLHAVSPALGIAAAIAVIAVVVIAVGDHHRPSAVKPVHSAATPAAARVPSPVSLLPARGGMRGLLLAANLLGSGSTLQVSFVQCSNCHGDLTPPDSREFNWSSTSTDGGATWRTTRQRDWLASAGIDLQEGHDLWASGFTPHPTDEMFFVSHDDGLTFALANAPTKSGYAPITVGGGAAWTFGTRCVHYVCASLVLRGRAGGSRLSRTAAEPPGLPARHSPTSLAVAGYGSLGYVSEGAHRRFYVTDNSGRTWNRAAYPCPAASVIRDLAPNGQSVWILCAPAREATPTTIRRSADGGRHWQDANPASDDATQLVAASPEVAWAQKPNGALERTADGGRSWQTTLTGVGRFPAVDVTGPTHAAVVAIATTGTSAAHTRRSDLVAYRTTDGGSHWTHTVIRLPTG